MKTRRTLICLVSITLGFSGTIFAGDNLTEAIQAQNQVYMGAYRSNDVDAIVALHTKNATVMAPKYPPSRGHDEIRGALVEELASGDGVLKLKTIEATRIDEEMAYEIGQYELRIEFTDGGVLEEEGSTLLLWKLEEDNTWRIHADMWNTNHPD